SAKSCQPRAGKETAPLALGSSELGGEQLAAATTGTTGPVTNRRAANLELKTARRVVRAYDATPRRADGLPDRRQTLRSPARQLVRTTRRTIKQIGPITPRALERLRRAQ